MLPSTIIIIKNVVLILLSFTLFNSLVVMIGGKKIFLKAQRNPRVSLYPILNLFNILEISDMQIFWGILFFVPLINCIVMSIMFYKLGEAFNQKTTNKIGLAVFPLCFYPLLSLSNSSYKLKDADKLEEFVSLKDQDINLLSDEELKQLSSTVETNTKPVDSIFKSNDEIIESMGTIEPYHANRKNTKENKDEELEIVEL